MSLRVVSPGTFTLAVDGGRPRSRSLGIPVGGPADRTSLAIGNALVGNFPFTPALEITLTGPTLVADVDVGLCIFGAPFHAFRGAVALEPCTTFTLRAGETLRIGGTPCGCRAYVCVPGGFEFPSVLASVTAFEPIKPGEILSCASSVLPGRSLGERLFCGNNAQPTTTRTLRCLPGPQADWFDQAFFQASYDVTPDCNRMGLRLDGTRLKVPKRELVSEAVAPGAVQITNEGKPIVLGVDGQTIGGYPKVAHIISADLDTLGQMRPGDRIRFQLVGEKKADEALCQTREGLSVLLRRIAWAI